MLVCAPKSIQMIGMMAGGMAPPEDPKEKAYVPISPKVLQALPMIQPGDSGTLAFDAPTKSGDYAYMCTVPGHFQTMHGVMLVVPDIDKYDEAPTIPNDPLTRRPYRQQKAE
jgi:azurin